MRQRDQRRGKVTTEFDCWQHQDWLTSPEDMVKQAINVLTDRFTEELAVQIGPRDTAALLAREMMAHWPESARGREWVWETYAYFLERAQRLVEGKTAPAEPVLPRLSR